jgi:hypothetical protein
MSREGAVSKIVKDLDALEFHGQALSTWKSLLHVISHAQSAVDGFAMGDTVLRTKLLSALENATSNAFMVKLWREVLSGYPSHDGTDVANAFRIFANLLRTDTPEWLGREAYCSTVMKGLVDCISDSHYSLESNALSSILLPMTDAYLWHFVVALSENSQSIQLSSTMTLTVEPMLILNIAKLVLKLAAAKFPQQSESSSAVQVASTLIAGAHQQGITAFEAVDALILSNKTKSVPEAYVPKVCAMLAGSIVSALPPDTMPEVMEAVGGVWGDKSFVSRADTWKQTLFTSTLLAALQRSEQSYLYRTGSRGVSLDVLLSVGISNYLDVDNIRIRKHGMRVACAYATLMGEQLHFAELDVVAKEEESALASMLQKQKVKGNHAGAGVHLQVEPATSSASAVPHKVSSSPRQGPATPVGYDSDSDSSTELQGYALGEDAGARGGVYDYKDRLLRTNYLRDCLQSKPPAVDDITSDHCITRRGFHSFMFLSSSVLRCPEAKPEARQQLQAALVQLASQCSYQ